MKKIYGLGKVTKGILTINNPQIFKEEIKGLSGDVRVEVIEGRELRSKQQNRYYWSVVCGLISEHTGYIPEEVHEFYKEKFLTNKKSIVIGNEEKEIEMATTTKLNTKEFEEYCENIRRHASVELSVNIPEPNGVIIHWDMPSEVAKQ